MSQIEFQNIPLKSIFPDPNQPRKFYDETAMEELTNSIKESGVLQPILVREQPDRHDKYLIVCGERRYQASKTAGLKEIPAIIRSITDEEALQLQIVENLQRKDVHPMEEAVAFKSFQESRNWSFEEIAKRVGKSEYYVKQRIKLNSLCDEFQKLFFQNKINITDALQVSKFEAEIQVELFNELVDDDDLNNPTFHLDIESYQLNKFRGKLQNATFDIEDATILPTMGACSNCQFNSAVLKLFPDQNGATCENIKCFNEKTNLSFQRNIDNALTDPSVVLIITDHNPDKQTKLLLTKYEGVLQPNEFLSHDAPECNDRDWYNGNNDTPEEDESDYQQDYAAYLYELEQWEARIRTGKYLKAFVLSGHQKGRYTYIELNKKGKAKVPVVALNSDVSEKADPIVDLQNQIEEIDNEISRIKEKEKRSKQIDENKIWEDLKRHFNPHANASVLNGPLTSLERKAIATAMYNKLNYHKSDEFRKLFKIDGRKGVLPEVDETTFNQMCRFYMLDILPPSICYSGFTEDADLSIEIAKEYFPGVLLEIQDAANLKTEKRVARIEKRIKELQDQKKELKAATAKTKKANK